MNITSLTKHINNCDFITFRDIAVQALLLKGYTDPYLTDGWKDGGTDIRYSQIPPNPAQLAIQLSVERDWKSKLKEDSLKAKDKLGIDQMLFISARRIPETEFDEVKSELFAEHRIQVSQIDAQNIASTFVRATRVDQLLDLLGISAQGTAQRAIFNPRANAAAALLLFGEDAVEFRTNLVRSTIIAELVAAGGRATQQALVNRVGATLRLGDGQDDSIAGVIDRMRQKGDVRGGPDQVTLDAGIATTYGSLNRIREGEWGALRDVVRTLISKQEPKARVSEQYLDKLLETMGAHLIDSAIGTARELRHEWDVTDVVRVRIRDRIRELDLLLSEMGVPSGQVRQAMLERISSEIAGTDIGHQLYAGELFSTITSMSTPELIRAFGGTTRFDTLVDASVAIPILGAMLYEPTNERFGFTSRVFYDRALAHGIDLILPIDYLQEIAAHLVHATRDYSAIVDEDEDLAGSENAFVAHYVGLRGMGKNISYDKYLDGFGVSSQMRNQIVQNPDLFLDYRNRLMDSLERLYRQFGFRVRPLGDISFQARKRAEGGVAYAIHELGLERPRILIEHDTRTVAFLFQQERVPDRAYVLCTWDRLHFRIRARESTHWDVLDPAAYTDLLAVCRPDSESVPAATPVAFVKTIGEEAMRRAARVWDAIIAFERTGLHNAELLALAKAFKSDFLIKRQTGFSGQDVVKDWQDWKAKKFH